MSTHNEEKDIRKYNLFVLLPNLADDEIETINQKIVKLIQSLDGKVIETNKMGKRKLSFMINKARHGFYINYVINLAVGKNDDLIKELKLLQEGELGILRFELSVYQKNVETFDANDAEEQETRKDKDKTKDKQKKKISLEEEKGLSIEEPKEKVEEPKKKRKISLDSLNEKLNSLLNNKNDI